MLCGDVAISLSAFNSLSRPLSPSFFFFGSGLGVLLFCLLFPPSLSPYVSNRYPMVVVDPFFFLLRLFAVGVVEGMMRGGDGSNGSRLVVKNHETKKINEFGNKNEFENEKSKTSGRRENQGRPEREKRFSTVNEISHSVV